MGRFKMLNFEVFDDKKKCTQCGITKELREFTKDKRRKDGRGSWCKECSNHRLKMYKREHRDENNLKAKEYYKQHIQHKKEYAKKYNLTHKKERHERHVKYYTKNRDTILRQLAFHKHTMDITRQYMET